MSLRFQPPRTALSLFVVGVVTFVLSRVVEHGFFHGMFQGMTIALMVIAAYIGSPWRRSRPDGEPESMWLPSRDDR